MGRWGTGFRCGLFGFMITAGVILLAGLIGVGFLLYKAYIPERMTLSGRVTDGSGKPIPLAKILAVPTPVRLDYIEDPIKTGAVVYAATCDSAGQFRIDRIIVGGGVKEGMWTQPYELQATAPGYQLKTIPFQRPPKQKGDMKLQDIILEKSPNP